MKKRPPEMTTLSGNRYKCVDAVVMNGDLMCNAFRGMLVVAA